MNDDQLVSKIMENHSRMIGEQKNTEPTEDDTIIVAHYEDAKIDAEIRGMGIEESLIDLTLLKNQTHLKRNDPALQFAFIGTAEQFLNDQNYVAFDIYTRAAHQLRKEIS